MKPPIYNVVAFSGGKTWKYYDLFLKISAKATIGDLNKIVKDLHEMDISLYSEGAIETDEDWLYVELEYCGRVGSRLHAYIKKNPYIEIDQDAMMEAI